MHMEQNLNWEYVKLKKFKFLLQSHEKSSTESKCYIRLVFPLLVANDQGGYTFYAVSRKAEIILHDV